jgi:hypothetical protein
MKTYNVFDLDFRSCMKRPVVVGACQVLEGPFQVQAIEGLLTGQPGDYVMKGIKGEIYICAKQIFEESYDLI